MKNLRYILFGNGDSPHLIKWARELAQHVDLFVVSPGNVHPEIRLFVPEDHCFALEIPTRQGGGNVKLLRHYHRFKKIIRQIQPDVVNAHYITSHGFIAALIRKNKPADFFLVQSAWGTDIMVTPRKNFLYRFITKYALKKSGLVTSDAAVMTDEIRKMCNREVLTFPFGLERMPDFSPEDKQSMLFFSNRALTANYRIDEVIRIFQNIQFHWPEARLIIANDGDQRVYLQNLTNSLALEKFVEFRGFLRKEEQDEIYRKAEFFISVPVSDTTSVSLLEAMAWGCIPVVSDLPANREWIRPAENGIIVSDSLEINIRNILNRKVDVISENGKIIKEKALFGNTVIAYIERLKEVIQG